MKDIEMARAKIYELVKKYGRPKIGRWVYCKYCHKHVLPIVNYDEWLVQCSECDYGLAPLDAVIKAGSYEKWWKGIVKKFEEKLNENKSQKPTS